MCLHTRLISQKCEGPLAHWEKYVSISKCYFSTISSPIAPFLVPLSCWYSLVSFWKTRVLTAKVEGLVFSKIAPERHLVKSDHLRWWFANPPKLMNMKTPAFRRSGNHSLRHKSMDWWRHIFCGSCKWMVTVVCTQHGQTKSPKIQFCNVAFGSRIVLLKTTKKSI